MEVLKDWLTAHSLILLLVIGTAFTFFWLQHLRQRLNMNRIATLLLAVLHTVCGVASVKIFAFLEAGAAPESVGNMSLFGGVFFMPLLYYIGAKVTRRKVSEVFDIFTICMVFTLMCARVNCIISGCCRGLLLPGAETLRWPTRELEIIFYLILLWVLGKKVLGNKNYGEIYPLYMIAYGIFRFITEWFRVCDMWGGIHPGHIWSIVSLGIGYSIYIEKTKVQKKGEGMSI